uniref:GRANULINS domain-containing protein n=1 Tax=Globodera pallida TaxID=36090 RepID=A0A183C9S7_GLOPA
MFQFLRFYLPLLGIACAVIMAPMLANANSDNASASAAFVQKSDLISTEISRIGIECDAFLKEKCTCHLHKCRPTQEFSAGICCTAGYVSECCNELFFPSACTSAANHCPCGWGTCVPNTGRAGDDCCNDHHSWQCCQKGGGAQGGTFIIFGSAVSQEFGWAKKCIIAFVVLFDLLMQRHLF